MACFVSPNAGSGGGIDLSKEYTPINGGLFNFQHYIQLNVKKGDVILCTGDAKINDNDFEVIGDSLSNGGSTFTYTKHPSLYSLIPNFGTLQGSHAVALGYPLGYYCIKDKQITIGNGASANCIIQLRKTSNYLPTYVKVPSTMFGNRQYENTSNGLEILIITGQSGATAGWKPKGDSAYTSMTVGSFYGYDPSNDSFYAEISSTTAPRAYVLQSGDGLSFSSNFYYALKRYNIVTD